MSAFYLASVEGIANVEEDEDYPADDSNRSVFPYESLHS